MAKRPVVLLADDAVDIADLLELYLEDFCDLRIWKKGFEELLSSGPWEGVDVALLDHMMPVSGLSIARYLRTTHPGIRIVFLTASGHTTDLYELADVVLRKPMPPAEIRRAVVGAG